MDSEYESGKTSLRIRRDVAANAAEGRPHGVPNYGFRAVYDERTGRLLTWERDPQRASEVDDISRAAAIKELFKRIKEGHAFNAIAQDFAARGIVGKSGKPFSPQHLRDLAIKPAYAGYRVHHGELIKGTWPALVDETDFWDVQRILSGDDHKSSSPRAGRAVHEFTATLKCDPCGAPISITHVKGTQYRCAENGCVRIEKEGVDTVVRGAILAYLSRPDLHKELSATPQETAELAEIDREIAWLRAELAEAERTVPESVHEAKTLGRLIEGLNDNIAAKQERRRALTVPPELAAFIEPGADVAARWVAAPVSARRKVAAILLTPEFLGEVRITRSPVRNHRVPAADRLVWRRNSSAA